MSEDMEQTSNGVDVVTRIAPSPTGQMHLGTARAALFNYLWAQHTGGKFIVRIEDTDPERDKKEFEEDILESLEWLGIKHDALYRQSEHRDAHTKAIQTLIDEGHAYVSKETAKDDPNTKVEIVRFKNPNRKVTFNDLVRGEVTFDTTDLKDFVIARSVTEPLHHLAVVVDDADEGVTLAMRGEDLLSNTPRQILIREALNLPKLEYLHLPLILASDRSKLSKRKHATSVGDYRKKGYLPEGLFNYLAFLGWHPGTDEEIFTKDELIERFTLDQIQKSPAMFDEVKLRWVNREHLLKMDTGTFGKEVEKYLSKKTLDELKKTKRFDTVLPLIRERIEVFSDIETLDREGELSFFVKEPQYDSKELLWKKEPSIEKTKEYLKKVGELLNGISETDWDEKTVHDTLFSYAEEIGKGNVLWPVRFALTGLQKSPDPVTVAVILGKDETLSRLNVASKCL